MASTLTGGCLCGAVRYTVSAPVSELRACHCTACQKGTGTAGSVNAVVPKDAFRITQGSPKRYSAKADSGRTLHRFFCADCGSPIYGEREVNSANVVVVRAGTLDDSSGMKISAHIWTKSARPWAHIAPGTQQHPTQPG